MSASIVEVAAALGWTARSVRRRASREGWPCIETKMRGGTTRRYLLHDLPEEAQSAVAAARASIAMRAAETSAPTDPVRAQRIAEAWADFEQAEGWRRNIAEVRLDALNRVAELTAQGRALELARGRVADALSREGATGCTASALKRWGRDVKGFARVHWLALLLPEPRGHARRTTIHPDAWAAFKRDYLRLEAPSVSSSYRRLHRIAKANPAWTPLPNLRTFQRRSAELPARVRTLARAGTEAIERMGPKIDRDRSGLAAMQAVNADGHKFDVAVKFPNGSIGRPVIVGWQDIASGKVLSYRIGTTETAELVRLSFCDMVKEYGIPQHAYLDNGRAFAAKQNTGGTPTRYRYKVREEDPQGVLTRLGVDVHWVTPYNGKAKPIERAWRDFAADIAKRPEFAGAYVGNGPGNKPENYGSHAVPYEEFVRVVADGVAEHNAREGRRSKVCEGHSFDATFAALYANATVTRATQTQLAMLLLASEAVKVRKGTGDVHLAGNRYWSEAQCEHQGKFVELRFDPEALHAGVHVFALDGSPLGFAPCVAALGHGTSEAVRKAMAAQRSWLKKSKELLAAELARDALALPHALPPVPTPAPPSAAVVKLHIPKRKATPVPEPAAPEQSAEERRAWDELYRNAVANGRHI